MNPNGRTAFWVRGIGRALGILLFWIIIAGGLGIALAFLFPGVRVHLPVWFP